ncbi:hypothetical protein F8S13_20025 [Chloroflexia bacterium SDU3-3]|nr:hypothetical protein F8S13_20025 [Chloroflexia bacterium SDU3-3]
MTHIFFPQWQGSHGRADLAPSAAALRQAIDEAASPTAVQWVDIPLIETGQQHHEQGILSRGDLLGQLGHASQLIRSLRP